MKGKTWRWIGLHAFSRYIPSSSGAQLPFDPPPAYRPTIGDSTWFVRDRFGMFIHWGLYSLGARHEWLQHNEQIPHDVYEDRYLPRFDPDLYDPHFWAAAAERAGMRYVVATA